MAGGPTIRLNTGAEMPLMAFGTLMGTLESDFEETVGIVQSALEVGYRHIDTARIYNTERMVAAAVRRSGISRQELFITTKLWRNSYGRNDVVPALKQSLADLNLEYVDLFLIHWPTAFKSGAERFPKDGEGKFVYADTDYLDTWQGMEECYNLGLAKAIGLSNFNSKQIQRILENGKVKPANNQIESHPFLSNKRIVDWCQARGITVTAYSPLAGFNPQYRETMNWPTIYTDPTIADIANKHNCSPAQISLSFQIDRQVCVAPKSSKKHRMIENFQSLNVKLCAEDKKELETCDRGLRLNSEFPDHPLYPFNEEF